ncbi:hypothetical protein C1H46_007545 [Malus baccata]|uniref:GST N-terminal domain-containing protein n=1 Tax=Malus baccata TaxID=106549 RepID=A0A540N705_MALBA|nr:hypothetical protein C1H46_007545 [Malus baccata]
MQLYHHPYSWDSQRVRLALEEKGIDYTSFHVNPVAGKNMYASFFRTNRSAKLLVFQNGHRIIYNTIEIIQYVERIWLVSSGEENIASSGGEVAAWKEAQAADLAPAYRTKLDQVYETEDKLKDPAVLKQNKEQLIRLLDQVETKLNESAYLTS